MNILPQTQQGHLQPAVDPDNLVIEKILGGDVAVFEILIRRYNTVLYRIAMSYGFNHQDAEDLMQEAHVAAYTSLSKFEHRASYKTWISRIMINKCLYMLKYGHSKYESPGDLSSLKNQPMHLYNSETHTGNLFQNRELATILEKSIRSLPEIYRVVFMLREVEGFSISETSSLLHISAVNVKVRLNRAKAMLQQEIEKTYSRSEIFSFNLVHCDAIVKGVFEKIGKI